MDRRTFFTATGAAGAAIAGSVSCGNRSDRQQKGASPRIITDIGGMSLEELREQYRYELFDDFLPFVEEFVVDHRYGGFMTARDHDGSSVNDNKSPYSTGRGIWLFSYLYNNFEKNPRFLDIAGKAVEFMMKHKPAGDGLWPNTLSREGDVIDQGGFSIARDCYMGEGFAEFGKATGDQSYVDLGSEVMRKCWTYYEKSDFQDGASPYPGARNMWYWMLFMWFGTNNYIDEEKPVVDECVTALIDHHVNPAFNLMNNVINHDLTLSDDPKYNMVGACGHATESLWMLMYEAVRRKDRTLFERSAELFRRHVIVSKDDVYGGVYNDCHNVDENIWQLRKIHWAQEFVLIGSLSVLEHTGAEWAGDMFAEQYRYIMEKFPLRAHGYKMWSLGGDRKMTFQPHVNRKEVYHHPRHLMLNLLTLDRMIERGGQTSSVFGETVS